MSIRSLLLKSGIIVVVLIAFVGGVGLFFAKSIGNSGYNVGAELAPLGDAAMEIKLSATLAHLIFEEIISGDEGEDIQVVWNLLDETVYYCDAILIGASNDEGTFVATKNHNVREKIEIVKKSVEEFIVIAHKRYDQRAGTASIGSGADQQFDEYYKKIQTSLSVILDMKNLTIYTIKTVGVSKYLLANGHLFLEEFLAGDDEVDVNEVKGEFTKAKEMMQALPFSEATDVSTEISGLITAMNSRITSNGSNLTAGSDADIKFDLAFEKFIAVADEAEEIIHEEMSNGLKDLRRMEWSGIIIILLITLTFGLIITIIILKFSKRISEIVEHILFSMKLITDGDLSVQDEYLCKISEFKSVINTTETMRAQISQKQDEIGENVKNMSELLGNISTVTEKLHLNSDQFANASSALSDGAVQQAAGLEEISSTVASIEQMSRENAEQATEGNKLSKTVST